MFSRSAVALAVIATFPNPVAVTTPFWSTVAILLFPLDHVIPPFVVFDGVSVAVRVVVAPYLMVD